MKYVPQNFELGKSYDTPFGNRIKIDKVNRATITVFDKWRVNNDRKRDKIVETHIRVAELYFYIEKRLFELKPKLAITTQHANESSWGFSPNFQNSFESINEFYKKPIWIYFAGKVPKSMRIEIYRDYLIYLSKSKIPKKNEDLKKYNAGNLTYLVIKDYLTETTIEEIMNDLLKINLR